MFPVLYFTFLGMWTLASLGQALKFGDGSTLFAMAIIWGGILVLEYTVARRRGWYPGFPQYLKAHRGRYVILVVAIASLTISMWAFFANTG